MAKKLNTVLSVLIIILLISALYKIQTHSADISKLYRSKETIDRLASLNAIKMTELYDSVRIKADEGVKKLNTESNQIILKTSKQLNDTINNLLQLYNSDLEKINSKILVANDMLQRARINYLNATVGKPDYKSFIEVFNNYYEKAMHGTTYDPLVTFSTSAGDLSFKIEDFEYRLSSTNNLPAWFQIGKKKSTENSELIKSWLNDAEQSKREIGYLLADSTTKDADYGEYTMKTMVKDDMFLTTYFQYERVQGTYGRHSMQYTYYVKVGSTKLNRESRTQEYTNKLGN